MPIAAHISETIKGALSSFPPATVWLKDLGAVLGSDAPVSVIAWEAGGHHGQNHAEGLALVDDRGIRVFTLEAVKTL